VSIVDADADLLKQLSLPESETVAIEARRNLYDAKQRSKSEHGWAKLNVRDLIALTYRFRNPGPAIALLAAIYDLIFEARKNPIRLTNVALASYGIDRSKKRYGLRQLVEAGVITVEPQGKQAVIVTYLWSHPHFPRRR
jgi:hypothetical protein